MLLKELNDKSPLRVLEGSMHGGLGRGNVGVVVAPAGIGKTALLVQIALDDLLRGRRVLHVSHEHPVDRVRSFYDELFAELVGVAKLADTASVKLEIERHRLIYSLPGNTPVAKLAEVVTFAREVAHFAPDVIIADGFDFVTAGEDAVRNLVNLAKQHGAELWISATVAEVPAAGSLPAPLDTLGSLLQVAVALEPSQGKIRLRLLKDHDNASASEVHLNLDPRTMRLVDG
jgi:predicted ATP-dependent serine protease